MKSRNAPRQHPGSPPAPRQVPAPGFALDPRIRYGTLPLRAFLGVTFAYAGLVKIADPGFLSPGSRTYLGTQLAGYAPHSPIGFLLTGVAVPLMPLTGVGVILLELAVGIATLTGVYTRLAAVTGAVFSFILFLSATWTVQPYFLGSDSLYTVAWITLALVGDLGLYSLQSRIPGLPVIGPRTTSPTKADLSRRELLLRVGAGAVGLVWLLAVLPRGAQRSGAVSPQAANPSASPGGSAPSPGSAPKGQPIGSLQQLQSSGSLSYTDPASGDPAVVVDLGGGHLAAFDAVCTHAGCTVSYDSSSKLLTCPCHGAEYDPAHNAAVVTGPAPTPLNALHVQTFNGTVYATD